MEINVEKLLKTIKLSAQIILENGGETYKAEETINFICKSLGVKEIDSIATPTGIYITISVDGRENNTVVKRITKRTINLVKLNKINNISRQLTQKHITLDEAIIQLEATRDETENNPKFYSLFYGGISAAFFTLLFGGGIFEFIVSLLSGIVVTLTTKKFENIHSYQFYSSIFAGIIIAVIAILSTHIAHFGNYNYIIVGGIMPQLPGLAMTNAIRDTMRGDLISGITRGADAILIAYSLAAGTGVVIYLSYAIGLLTV